MECLRIWEIIVIYRATRRKKMIYIISPFESKFLARGTRSVTLANMLVEAGYKVTFITSNFNHEHKKNYSNNEMMQAFQDEKYTTNIISVPAYKKNLSFQRVWTHWVFAFKLYFMLKNRISDGDIIVTMLSFPELTVVDKILKSNFNIISIIDVWDIWPDAFPFKKSITAKLFTIYCNKIYNLTLNKYDHIVYVSPSFLSWVKRYTNNMNYSFIPLGYDVQRWDSFENKHVMSKINLVYVGYLSYQFDIRLIIESVNKNDSLIFHIIGDGEIINELKNLSTTERNIFYGKCKSDRVVEILEQTDIAILPISKDSTAYMPNKLFDYIGGGLPILSMGTNDSSKLILEYNCGWVVDYDLDKVLTLFDTLTKEEIAVKAQNMKIIRNKYSKENLYNEFLNIINIYTNKELMYNEK